MYKYIHTNIKYIHTHLIHIYLSKDTNLHIGDELTIIQAQVHAVFSKGATACSSSLYIYTYTPTYITHTPW